ncbi:hypothetical protein TWF281_004916 [Arthrobotrys megalospora]
MANQQSQFSEIWAVALDKYRAELGYDLATTSGPTGTHPTSIEEFKQQIESSQSKFKEYRNAKLALWSSVSSFLGPVEKIGELVAEGAGTVFAPAPMIMGAVSFLIKGAEDVSQCYDYIEDLLDDMKAILDRLDIHAKNTIHSKLKNIYTDILACILETIGVSTKYVKDGRFKRYLKKTFTDDDKVTKLKERLGALVSQETAIVGALNLNTTMDVLEQTTTTAVVVTDIDGKVDGIAQSVQQISLDLQAATSAMATSNAGPSPTDIRALLEPQTSVEDELESINCLSGTGGWVLSEPLIHSWTDGKTPLLLLSGGPGTGKSHLSSLLIKHLRDEKSKDPEAPSVCYFFFKEDNVSRTDFSIALKTMAYQLAISDKAYFAYLDSISDDLADKNATIFSLWRRLFLSVYESSTQRVRLIFDGLDEAKQSDLESFLDPLVKISEPSAGGVSKISILFVGRPDVAWNIEEVFYEHPVPVIDVGARKNNQDIRKFLLHRLKKYKNLVRMKKIQSEITEKLIDGANGMFLWIDLMLKELSTKDRESAVRKALDNMPKTLGDLYRRMLNRVSETLADEPDQAQDLNELLMWMGFAVRPLSLSDLEYLLGLRYGEEEDAGSFGLFDKISKKYASFFSLSSFTAQGGTGLALGDAWFDPEQTTEEDGDDDDDKSEDDKSDDNQDDEEEKDEEEDGSGDNDEEAMEEWLLKLRDNITVVRPRHASFRDFLKAQTSKPTLVGIIVADTKLHILKTCMRILLNPARMPGKESSWTVNIVEALNSPNAIPGIMFSNYAMQYWVTHLQAVDRSSAPLDAKVDILTSIYKIHTLPDVVMARFMYPGQSDIDMMSVTGEAADTILAWVKDEEVVSGCEDDVQKWAAKVRENRKELVEPLVAELYQHALCGKSNILQSWSEALPNSRRILRALMVYLDKFHPSTIPNNDFASNQYTNLVMPAPVAISILSYPSLEKNALWYGSVACFLCITGNKPEAVDFFEKAIHLSADDSSHKLIIWTFLAQASTEAGDDETASKYIKQIFDAIDTSFGGLEQIPTSGLSYSLPGTLNPSSSPWVLDRENAAKLVHWLATLRNDDDSAENIDEQISYYRKAIILNIHDDSIIDGVMERAMKDSRWIETAKFATDLMDDALAIGQPAGISMPRSISYYSNSIYNGRASALIHPALRTLGETSEELLEMWEIVMGSIKALSDRGVVLAREQSHIEYAKIFEIEGQVGKAIDMLQEAVEGHVWALQTGTFAGSPFDSKMIFAEVAWFLARHLFDEDEDQEIRERCLKRMETICKDLSPTIPDVEAWFAASMGLYYQQQGRKAEGTACFKKQAEIALRYMGDDQTVFLGWTALSRLANAIDDEELMKMVIWCSMTQPHPNFSLHDSEYYENKHGRRWPLSRVKAFIACKGCRAKVLIPGSPINICKSVAFDIFCDKCLDKIRAGSDSVVKHCSSKHSWRVFDIASFPGPKQEKVSDEEERKMILDSVKKRFSLKAK